MILNPIESNTTESTNRWSKVRKFIFFICLIGFSYQILNISREYYSYETEVKTHIKEPKDKLDLPAITICTPVTHLKTSLRKLYPQLSTSLAQINKENISNQIKEFIRDKEYSKHAKYAANHHFFKTSVKETDFMECNLHVPTILMIDKKWYLHFTDCSAIIPVMESQVQSYGKCFTYFSQQYSAVKELTDFQIKPTKFTILDLIITFDFMEDAADYNYLLIDSLRGQSKRKIYMFIHQTNSMPSFDPNDAIELEKGKQYDIVFSKTTKSLLKAPFDTNCLDYSKNLMKECPKSTDQCIRHCHSEKSNRILGCVAKASIVANDYALKKKKIKSCARIQDFLISIKLMNICMKTCKVDCKQTQYHINSRQYGHNFVKVTSARNRSSTKFSLVSVRYKGKGDLEYQYIPVLTRHQCLLRMLYTVIIWFGLSIFSFFTVFEMAFKKAKPRIIDDKVSANVISVMPQSIPVNNKFLPTQIGSNVKLEHYNNFISQVVDGYPTQNFEMPLNKTQTPNKC